MSCACVLKLADLLKGLMPGVEVPVPEAPALEPLASIAAPLSAARSVSGAQLATIANMPPLPLDAPQLASVQAAMQAAGEMAAMGLSPMSPLAAAVAALNANFAALPPPAPPSASLLQLSMVCARVTAVSSMLGVDLLSPAALLVPVRPMLGAGLASFPRMNLGPLAKLEFPNVAPLTLAMATANTAGVVSSSACSSSCPMGGKF